jgi:RHS repeat-associated protein
MCASLNSFSSGSTANMTHNAFGHRVYMTYPGRNPANYFLDPQGLFLGGYTAGYGWSAAIPLGGRQLAMYAAGASEPVYFDHPNALGSEGQWTDAGGNYAGEVQFCPWGQVCASTITNGSIYQTFAGLELYDPETDPTDDGYQTPNRYYVTRHQRWLTPDPLGQNAADPSDPQTWNMYGYARNNPTSLVDPLGLFANCPNGEIQNNQCIQWTPPPDDEDDDLSWSDTILYAEAYYHPPSAAPSPVSGGGGASANNVNPCSNVPKGPPGESATANLNLVNQSTKGMWPATKLAFFDMVFRTGGPFDYKNTYGGPGWGNKDQFVDYGNWNFGYVCGAHYPSVFCQSAAGWNRMSRARGQGQKVFGNGFPLLIPPFGDQKADNQQIINGIKAQASGCVQ